MFSSDIVDSDKFLDMSATARLLYYDLGMRADDDGFVSPKKVMRMTSASEDDLRVLIAKNFIIPFETGVIVIKDWKMNNYIQKDRYTETIYKEEKGRLSCDNNNSYVLDTTVIQNVSKLDTQVRLGKVRIGNNISKDMEDESSLFSETSSKRKQKEGNQEEYGNTDINKFIRGLNKYLQVKLPEDGRARRVAKNSLDLFTKHKKTGTVKEGREFLLDDKWENVKWFLSEYTDKKIKKGYSAQSWDTLYRNVKLWVANNGSLGDN